MKNISRALLLFVTVGLVSTEATADFKGLLNKGKNSSNWTKGFAAAFVTSILFIGKLNTKLYSTRRNFNALETENITLRKEYALAQGIILENVSPIVDIGEVKKTILNMIAAAIENSKDQNQDMLKIVQKTIKTTVEAENIKEENKKNQVIIPGTSVILN